MFRNFVAHIPKFQSTLPRGSDSISMCKRRADAISIHAPSRERRGGGIVAQLLEQFQSTLPRGSDAVVVS